MTQQVIGFVNEKAPGGGYKLSKIISLQGADGTPELRAEVITYRTRLVEIQGIEHQLKEQLFGEAAWYPLAPPMAPRPPVPMSEPHTNEEELPPGMPNVVQSYAENGGLMGELYKRSNGAIRSLVPALVIGALWLSFNMSRLGVV
jgi:hypothetical protein